MFSKQLRLKPIPDRILCKEVLHYRSSNSKRGSMRVYTRTYITRDSRTETPTLWILSDFRQHRSAFSEKWKIFFTNANFRFRSTRYVAPAMSGNLLYEILNCDSVVCAYPVCVIFNMSAIVWQCCPESKLILVRDSFLAIFRQGIHACLLAGSPNSLNMLILFMNLF